MRQNETTYALTPIRFSTGTAMWWCYIEEIYHYSVAKLINIHNTYSIQANLLANWLHAAFAQLGATTTFPCQTAPHFIRPGQAHRDTEARCCKAK